MFIHGSPGDWQAWSGFLDDPALIAFGPRKAVDRPGFGGSKDDGIVTNLRQQAALFSHLLPSDQPSIVVGHSLGAPIAAWLAIDNPQSICGVVSVAGSLAPDLEALRWYNEITRWKMLQPLIPQDLIESNREMLVLQDQLNILDQAWPQLQRPFVALQGMQDELVNPATVDYLEATVDAALLLAQRFPEQGHFVLWETPQLVTDAIVQLNNRDCLTTKANSSDI